MSLDFLTRAAQLKGASLLEGLRQAPRLLQFGPPAARAPHVTRLAKVSPLHALLALLPDHPNCPALFKAAYAQNAALALTWASYAVSSPPWSLAPWVEQHRSLLRQAILKEPTRLLSFAFQGAYRAAYSGSGTEAQAFRRAFYDWLAHRQAGLTPLVEGGGSRLPGPTVGLFSENYHDAHVLKRTCQPEIDALRAAGYSVWLLQTGSQGRPVSGIDGVIQLQWDGHRLTRGPGPALDALFFLEPFGTIVDAVGAGQRWAPVQFACGVTPTPLPSPQVDYWIQGALARFPVPTPVIEVPGPGVTSIAPPVTGSGDGPRTGLLVASAPHKWSAPFLGWLQTLNKAGIPLTFVPGAAAPEPVLTSVLRQLLPRKGWQLQVGLSPAAYLQVMASSQGVLDAFPYGGLSTLVDAAYTATPVFLPPGENGTQAIARGLGQHYGHGVSVAAAGELVQQWSATQTRLNPPPEAPPVAWLPALRHVGR